MKPIIACTAVLLISCFITAGCQYRQNGMTQEQSSSENVVDSGNNIRSNSKSKISVSSSAPSQVIRSEATSDNSQTISSDNETSSDSGSPYDYNALEKNIPVSSIRVTQIDTNLLSTLNNLCAKIHEVVGWFIYYPKGIGVDNQQFINEFDSGGSSSEAYNLVKNPSFNNMKGLKAYLKSNFSDQFIMRLLLNNCIVEINGKLYVEDVMGGEDDFNFDDIKNEKYYILKQSVDRMNVYVYVPDSSGETYGKFFLDLQKSNGKWIVMDTDLG